MKLTGVKRAVSEINNNTRLARILYLNMATGKVWVELEPSMPSLIEPNDGVIIIATIKDGVSKKITMKELTEMVKDEIAAEEN